MVVGVMGVMMMRVGVMIVMVLEIVGVEGTYVIGKDVITGVCVCLSCSVSRDFSSSSSYSCA